MMKKLIKFSAIPVLAVAFSAPALATPKSYVVDPTHSFANFSYTHMGLSEQESRFDGTSGTIVYDAAAKTGAVNVEIDTTSVDTGSDALDEHLRGADFFDSSKHPKATYKSTRIVFKGDTPVAVEGNLTIKGTTKPVTMTIDSFSAKEHPMKRKDALGAKAHMKIKRSDFGLSKFVPAVSDVTRLNGGTTDVFIGGQLRRATVEPHGRDQSFGRDGLRLSVRSWQRVLVPDGAGEDTGDQAGQDVAAARCTRPRRGGRRNQRGVAAGARLLHVVQVGEAQLRVDEAGKQRLITELVRVFEGPHNGDRALEDDVAARGIVEEIRVAQGGCGDLIPLRRRAEPRQQPRSLTVVRGEDSGLGVDGVRQLRNQVEAPGVDDERHAGLAAELREFERVLASVLVQSWADEGRLDAPAHHDDARLGG